MRQIITKYDGECRKCGTTLEIGTPVIYEKRVGIFCVPCGPTDPEEIRKYRQEGADRKADRLEGWAAKRHTKAEAVFKSHEPLISDWAFITQPGHIPIRARINRQRDKQFESLNIARHLESRAASLRHVRVKGDAEARHQAYRDKVAALLTAGARVSSCFFGEGIVLKIFKKSARVKWNRGFENTCNLGFMKPL